MADLHRAAVLMATYEKHLHRAGAARAHALAELARLCFILGEWGGQSGRRKYFDQGRHYAEILRREQPRRVEGHYWLALNLSGLAEIDRASRDLKMVPVIVRELQVAANINPRYNQAGPDRVLGRIYYEAPVWPLSVGDLEKSRQSLQTAVKLAPENSTNHLYLAETLLDLGETDQAYQELHRVLKATSSANWAADLQDDHRKALRLLQKHHQAP